MWLWVIVPIASLGIAGFVPPVYFAVRYGRKSGYVWAVVLLAAISGFFVVYPGPHRHGVREGVATALIMTAWVGGAAVAGAFVVTTQSNDSVAIARERRNQRQRARALIAKDPRLAVDAGIGRPDVAGEHDDGGLVDVNRVPAASLAALPGITKSLAERIVETRKQVGGFSSLDDLIATLNLNPRDLDDASEQLAFIPL
jgi:DNA uptake protein ComE-like DNA-binding protein